jgi:hypothetical protein
MKLFLISLLLILLAPFAVFGQTTLSGNLEAQGRQSWNNDLAKEDLFQQWDQDEFYLVYGNLNGKTNFLNAKIEANLFARYTKSDLYQDQGTGLPGIIAPQIFTYPNKLVARDVFRLQHLEESQTSRSEWLLNKLYFEMDFEDNRFMLGRIYINYGLGEIFNPINPFNQPVALTSISQIAQGSDGGNFTFFVDDKYTINFYFLGDKNQEGYENQIEQTLWIHGEYQATNNLQLDYVVGTDQNRHKLGGQISYNFSEAMVFSQLLYQSDFTDDKESHPLWDALVGFDQQMSDKWHLRVESGFQKANRFASSDLLNDRFLPTEYFVALASQYEIHPLIKLGGTVINDIKSGFTYFVTRNTMDLGFNTEAEIFAYLPVAKGDSTDNVAQKLVTTDVGVALRTFF